MLKRWLALPLKNGIKIKQRHEVVTYLLDHEDIHKKIQHQLKQIGDLERLISKVATGKINPREVVQLKNSMSAISPVKAIAIASENEALQRLGERLQNGELLSSRIKEMLTEEAPVQIQKGNVIAPGFSDELDELRNLSHSGKSYLDAMLERETERTGIPSLKIDQ